MAEFGGGLERLAIIIRAKDRELLQMRTEIECELAKIDAELARQEQEYETGLQKWTKAAVRYGNGERKRDPGRPKLPDLIDARATHSEQTRRWRAELNAVVGEQERREKKLRERVGAK